MTNTAPAPWKFTATTVRGKSVQHSATSQAKARKLRKAIARLPFVVDTTTPTKTA